MARQRAGKPETSSPSGASAYGFESSSFFVRNRKNLADGEFSLHLKTYDSEQTLKESLGSVIQLQYPCPQGAPK
jgi:hypothetical protein